MIRTMLLVMALVAIVEGMAYFRDHVLHHPTVGEALAAEHGAPPEGACALSHG